MASIICNHIKKPEACIFRYIQINHPRITPLLLFDVTQQPFQFYLLFRLCYEMSESSVSSVSEITGKRPCDGLRVDLKRCLLQGPVRGPLDALAQALS